MSALRAVAPHDELLANDVLAHLDEQLTAARQLLSLVLEQGAAIRRRDVQAVVRMAGLLQAEMLRRELLEARRMRLLTRAGERLGVPAGQVSLSLMTQLMDPSCAAESSRRSGELRGMLAEIQREHHVNRALMSQELSFLDHLLRLTGQTAGAYDAGGSRERPGSAAPTKQTRVLDMQA